MADPNDSSSPSHQLYRQSHTYSPQTCHAQSFSQRYPHQVSNVLPQRLDASMASSRINSSKQPSSAHHTSHLGHPPTFPSKELCLDRSNVQLSPCIDLLATISSPVGYDNYLNQHLTLTPVQAAPSHSISSRTSPPTRSRVQSTRILSFGHPHSCQQSSATLSLNNIEGGSMYVDQSQDQTFLGLNMGLSSSSQIECIIHSSTYHHQGHSTALSANSHLPSPPVSPVSPLIPHFSKSQSSLNSSTSTPSSISTPAIRPRVGTAGTAFHLPLSLAYPTSSSRPFRCKTCKLSFVRRHDLKRHNATHTGSRPHMCSTCGNSYTRNDALIRHQLIKQCGKNSSRNKKKNDD